MRRLAWIALVVAGCGGSSLTAKDIELDIAVQATISDDEVATVRSLDIAVTGDASSVMTYPLSRALARSERLVVHFPSAQGHVIVSVLARDAQSLIVMRGASGEVHLESGGPHPAMATLALPAAGAHSASGIELVPASFTLFTGQSLQLAAKGETVTWSAMDGGAVDDTGLFAAPATAGIYHAVAQSTLYPTDKASVTLNVLATGIALYAGSLGGLGTVDGVGTAARVNQPQSMLLDGGALYFTDVGQAIRRADIQTGAVTTLAGRPDYALTVDGAGAGAGFVIPAGMVFDGNSTLYVAESACPCIRAVAVGTGQTTTIAGKVGNGGTMDGTGAAAQFRWPQGLAYDAAKHLLYVGEDAAHTIRTVDVTNGTVTTIAGVPDMAGSNDGPANAATFNNPSDFVLDGGVLYIHDRGTSKIRQLDLGTMQVVTLASNVNTSTMTSAGSGKLALALPLRIFDVASKTTTEIRDSDKQQVGDWFNSLVLAPDGTYWGGSVNTLTHYDVAAGKKTRLAGFDYQWQETEGPRTMAGIGSFNSFVVRSDGAVFLRDNRIVRIDSDGKLTSVAGSPSAPVLSGDGGMTFGSDGMLYALDRYSHVIMRIDVDHGGAVTTFAGKASTPGFADGTGVSARLSGPADVTADGNKLYFTDQRNDVVRAVDVPTGAITTLAGGPGMCGYLDMPGSQARFCGPEGIVADGSGNLYVADNNAIRKIVIATGAVSSLVANNGVGFVDGPSGTAKLWGPGRITLDAAKKYLYFGEYFNDAVRKVDLATGIVSTVSGGPGKTQIVEGPLPGSINQPGAIQFAATGELLVAVTRENAVVQIRLP